MQSFTRISIQGYVKKLTLVCNSFVIQDLLHSPGVVILILPTNSKNTVEQLLLQPGLVGHQFFRQIWKDDIYFVYFT